MVRMDSTTLQSTRDFHTTFLLGGVAIYQPGDALGPRRLSDFEIVWIITGSMTYRHNEESDHLPAGTVYLARPGFEEHYQWSRHEISRHAFVHFDIERRPSDWPEQSDWPLICDASMSGLARGLFREVMGLMAARTAVAKWSTPSAREQRLLATLLDVMIMPGGENLALGGETMPAAVRRALDTIVANIEQDGCPPLDLDELARAARVSRPHLTRLFREHVGHTPVAAVRLARLDRAMTLLERSNLSISQIADRLGFASPYHFSRRFSQAFGSPPSRMRQQLQAGGPRPAPRIPLASALALL